MTEQKHTLHVAPAPELTLPEVLQRAKEACDVAFELFFKDQPGHGSEMFQILKGTLSSIRNVATKSEVDSLVDTLIKVCEQLSISSSQVGLGETDLTPLSAEIERRQTWLSELSQQQGSIEEALDEVESELLTIARDLKFAGDKGGAIRRRQSLETQKVCLIDVCQKFGECRTQVKEGAEKLQSFVRAVQIIRTGYPAELLNAVLPTLPEIPEPKQTQEVAIVVETSGTTGILTSTKVMPPQISVTTSDRRLKLHEIAEEHGLYDVEVFMYTLYDFFGPLNGHLKASVQKARGGSRVVNTALAIAPDFEWVSADDFFPDSGWKNSRAIEAGYLIRRGQVGKTTTWMRSEKPLPWDSRLLFTEAEITLFLERMTQKLEYLPREK